MPVCLAVRVRGKIALCPQPGRYALAVGKLSEPCKVFHIGVHSRNPFFAAFTIFAYAALHIIAVLPVTAAVTVIGKEVPKRHVIMDILLKNRPCRIFVRGVYRLRVIFGGNMGFFSVQGLGMKVFRQPVACCHTTFIPGPSLPGIGLTSLHNPCLAARFLRPCIPVIAVQMPFVETILRKQHRVSCHMVVSLQELLHRLTLICRTGQEVICAELIFLMFRDDHLPVSVPQIAICLRIHLLLLHFSAKIITSLGKCVAQRPISCR